MEKERKREKERTKERKNFFSILWKAFVRVWYVFENTISWNCMVQDHYLQGLLLVVAGGSQSEIHSFFPPDHSSFHILKRYKLHSDIKKLSPVRTFQLDLSHSCHSFFQKYLTFTKNVSPFKLRDRTLKNPDLQTFSWRLSARISLQTLKWSISCPNLSKY